MSIMVNIYYTGTNGNARKFAEEMERSGTARAIREEAGNLRYDYFFPMADPETVLLIDCWESQEKIAGLRIKYGLHMKVERYECSEGGIPERDSHFIKE